MSGQFCAAFDAAAAPSDAAAAAAAIDAVAAAAGSLPCVCMSFCLFAAPQMHWGFMNLLGCLYEATTRFFLQCTEGPAATNPAYLITAEQVLLLLLLLLLLLWMLLLLLLLQ